MLHVVSDSDLRYVEQAVVNAARNVTDLSGKPVMVATIDSRTLRQAAKIAVSMAISGDVWDGSEILKVPPPQRVRGVVDMEG